MLFTEKRKLLNKRRAADLQLKEAFMARPERTSYLRTPQGSSRGLTMANRSVTMPISYPPPERLAHARHHPCLTLRLRQLLPDQRGRRPDARRLDDPQVRQDDPGSGCEARGADRAHRPDARTHRSHRLTRRTPCVAARGRGPDLEPRRAPARQGSDARSRRAADEAAR